jgi:hypothetical protein
MLLKKAAMPMTFIYFKNGNWCWHVLTDYNGMRNLGRICPAGSFYSAPLRAGQPAQATSAEPKDSQLNRQI